MPFTPDGSDERQFSSSNVELRVQAYVETDTMTMMNITLL